MRNDKAAFIAVLFMIFLTIGLLYILSSAKKECREKGGTLVHPGTCIRAEKIEL